MTAEYIAPEICSGSTNLHFMVFSSYSSDYGVVKLGQVEYLGRQGFRLPVESRDPYSAALAQKHISVLGPLVQAAETGTAAGKPGTALSSTQAAIPLPCDP